MAHQVSGGPPPVDGLAIVDKPPGMTSHDVVARCRRLFHQKRVGHGGTLDPDATGVLLVAVGRATRLVQLMVGLNKSYEAEVVLGTATSTLDASGLPTGRWDQSGVTLAEARAAAARLTGRIEQTPPMVSALKVGGRRLHELARSNVEVERRPREVTVHRFEVERVVDPTGPVLAVKVDCSSGTYVRSLAADLGSALGGGAHLRRLRRLSVGPWTLEQAVPLASLSAEHTLPPAECLPWLPRVEVDEARAAEISHGRVLPVGEFGAVDEVEPDELRPAGRTGPAGKTGTVGPVRWLVLGPDGGLLAVYQHHRDGLAKPLVVLASG